jgi:hypothetical protein
MVWIKPLLFVKILRGIKKNPRNLTTRGFFKTYYGKQI